MDICAQGYSPTDFPWETGKGMAKNCRNLCWKTNGKASAKMNFAKSCLLIQKLSRQSPKLRTFHVNHTTRDPEYILHSFFISLKWFSSNSTAAELIKMHYKINISCQSPPNRCFQQRGPERGSYTDKEELGSEP